MESRSSRQRALAADASEVHSLTLCAAWMITKRPRNFRLSCHRIGFQRDFNESLTTSPRALRQERVFRDVPTAFPIPRRLADGYRAEFSKVFKSFENSINRFESTKGLASARAYLATRAKSFAPAVVDEAKTKWGNSTNIRKASHSYVFLFYIIIVIIVIIIFICTIVIITIVII